MNILGRTTTIVQRAGKSFERPPSAATDGQALVALSNTARMLAGNEPIALDRAESNYGKFQVYGLRRRCFGLVRDLRTTLVFHGLV